MKKTLSAHDRALHIELVRARAAIERQCLRTNFHELAEAVRPAALLREVMPGLAKGTSSSPVDWVLRVLSLSRRYPLLTSGATALLSGAGRRHRLLKVGLGLFVAWRLNRARQK